MVLPMMLYQVPEVSFPKMMDVLNDTCNQMEASLRVELNTNVYQEAQKCIEKTNNVMMLITYIGDILTDEGKQALILGQQAMTKNRDNYVVYVAKDNKVLLQMASYCTRPAGMVTDQMLCTRGQRLMKDILRDYKNIYVDKPEDHWLSLKTKSVVTRVNMSEICAITSMNKMIEVITTKTKISVYDSLESISQKLGDQFARCHRSCIVNLDRIQYVDFHAMTIKLTDGTEVPLARSYRQAFHGMLEGSEQMMKEGEA